MARSQLGAAPSRAADLVTRGSLTRHFVKATGGSGSGNSAYTTLGGSFTTIPLGTVVYDTAAGFSTSTYIYTAPITGYFDVSATLRPCDYVGAINIGIGVGTSNGDSPTFAWFSKTASSRNTFIYAQAMKFNAGDQVRLFGYADSSGTQDIAAASLSLSQIG